MSAKPSKPPKNMYFGAEYTKEDINKALISENPLELVPQTDDSGHGTFLAGIASSREQGDTLGIAPDSEIIMVKMDKANDFYRQKALIPSDVENAYDISSLILGVQYLLDKATELNKPIVICIAVGTNSGNHDGLSYVEDYLSKVGRNNGVAICVSAGNESLARHHASGKIEKTGELSTVKIKTVEGVNEIFLSVWNNCVDKISVSVSSPTGQIVKGEKPISHTVTSEILVFEKTTVEIEYIFPIPNINGQNTIIKILNPIAGIWEINLNGDFIIDGEYNCWLPITGFINPQVEFLNPDPYNTLVLPANSPNLIVCGGYNNISNSLYVSSSWGSNKLNSISPTLVAPSVNVTGVYPSGAGTMTGTSVSSAVTAGAVALILEWGIVKGNDTKLNNYIIKTYLARGCTRNEGDIYPNEKWGYGKLNLSKTFELINNL